MATCIKNPLFIVFENPKKPDDNWVRLDASEDGVTVDRAGLYHLTADECRELSAWLYAAAVAIPPKAIPSPVVRRGRRAKAA